jgi:Tfp pilus assembly protein PilN
VVLILVLLLVSNKNKVLSHKVIELENKKASLIYVSSEQDLLTNRILTLKKLHRKKIPWSKVLYDLGTSVPKGVYFEEITTSSRLISTTGTEAEKKIRIVVVGNSQSQKKVLNFIKNLEQTFEDIIIENIKGERRCEFKISLGL